MKKLALAICAAALAVASVSTEQSPAPAGFSLTGFFLHRYVLEPRGLAEPPERARLVELAARAALA